MRRTGDANENPFLRAPPLLRRHSRWLLHWTLDFGLNCGIDVSRLTFWKGFKYHRALDKVRKQRYFTDIQVELVQQGLCRCRRRRRTLAFAKGTTWCEVSPGSFCGSRAVAGGAARVVAPRERTSRSGGAQGAAAVPSPCPLLRSCPLRPASLRAPTLPSSPAAGRHTLAVGTLELWPRRQMEGVMTSVPS